MVADMDDREGHPLPAVTAVIPTRGRPNLLRRAIDSALLQTGVEMRVLVVIDGPYDAESEAVVRSYATEPLTFHALETNRGPAVCRTFGAAHAQTEWIAFLDDDDYWYPEKISRQLDAIPPGEEKKSIVFSQSDVVTPSGTYCWPRRMPKAGERAGDYLFCRHSLFKGESFLQASSILCHREIFERFPMQSVAHEDWDWVLRACELGGNRLIVVPEPLLCHLAEFRRNSLSNRHEFSQSMRWCESMRRVISREAFAGLLLQTMNGALTERGDWRGGLGLMADAFRKGRPRGMDLLMFLAQWVFPVGLRRRLRALLWSYEPPSGVGKT